MLGLGLPHETCQIMLIQIVTSFTYLAVTVFFFTITQLDVTGIATSGSSLSQEKTTVLFHSWTLKLLSCLLPAHMISAVS